MAAISLTFLGAFQALRDGTPITHFRGDKVRALLAYLASEADRPHARTTLAALLWPEQGDEGALRNLAQALVRLRGALGDTGALLDSSRQAIQWRGDDAELDVAAFRRLARSVEPADLERAADLYHGEFLAGFSLPGCEAFEEWLLLTREQLAQQALAALQTLADQHLAAARYEEAASAARRQLALDPWHEQAHRQLMRALAGGGDRAAALAAYEHCRQTLRDDLGVEPDDETRALAERIRAGELSPVTSSAPAHSLPAQLTPFVGRERELSELATRLRQPDVRLLTLVGAGGMGKTRLALEVARALLADLAADQRDAAGAGAGPAFPDGVFFVSLAPLSAAAAIAPTIAAAIGLTLHGGDPSQVVLRFLRDKRLLLILDNFEHLLDSPSFPSTGSGQGVGLVLDILQTAPHVQLIATSRERFNVRGEHVYIVEGMDYAIEEAAASSAVRLFVQSARGARPDFKLSDANAPHVLRICDLVQGMPLGLELAAAWVEMVPVDTIAAEIERSADFLAFDWRDVPGRQRSLRAVFDWSWHLLNDGERQVFRRLSVFRGGFTPEAAQAVVDASLRVLTSLTHKSLLRWGRGQGAVGRYELHELLRQFAARSLDAAQERAAVEQRHSQFFLAFVAQREVRLARREPLQAAAEIQAELDNIRAAWAWAAAHSALDDLAASAFGLWQFDYRLGLAAEGAAAFRLAAEYVQAFCDQPGIEQAARRRGQQLLSTLLAFQASLLTIANAYDQALAIAEQAIAIGQTSGGVEGETIGWFAGGQALYRKGQYQDAREHAEHALALVQQHQIGRPASEILLDVEWRMENWLRGIYAGLGDYPSALAHGRRALQLCQAQERRFGEISSLANLADIAREMRDYAAARAGFEQVLRLAPGVYHRWGEGVTWLELGEMVRLQGEYGLASELMLRALARFREIGERVQQCRALAYLGRLHCFLGDYAGPHEWLGQAEQLLEHVTAPETRVEAFGALAIYALHTGAAAQALVYAEQGWRLAREFVNPYGQAQALVELAHAQAALRRAEAASTYQHALERYQGLGHVPLAAEPRAGLAALALVQGDLAAALAHGEALLCVLAEHPRAGLDEPFDVYLTCYRVLAANGDPRAVTLLTSARRQLLDYAANIGDTALRTSFLEQVATHRELLRDR